MRYRVIQTHTENFFPQWKGWFFWHNFTSDDATANFFTKEEAEQFIKDAISYKEAKRQYPKVVREWPE